MGYAVIEGSAVGGSAGIGVLAPPLDRQYYYHRLPDSASSAVEPADISILRRMHRAPFATIIIPHPCLKSVSTK